MTRARGEAIRDRRTRARSGPNISEEQRHTRRLRLARRTFELAEQLADAAELSVADLIASLVSDAADARRRSGSRKKSKSRTKSKR